MHIRLPVSLIHQEYKILGSLWAESGVFRSNVETGRISSF